MPLKLRPATEADALRIVTIQRDSYKGSPVERVLFTGPIPPDVLEHRAAEFAQSMREDPTVRWLVVVDTGDEARADGEGEGEVIASAQWIIWDPQPPPSPPRAWESWMNAEACEMLFGGLAKQRERLLGGRSVLYLRFLNTDPKHQRRGAGAMLVQWGIDEADRRGLPAFLNSSEAGHALYRKYGFIDLEEHHVDLSKWDVAAVHRNWAMIREVAPSSTSS